MAPTDFAAQAIVSALDAEGVRAWFVGGVTIEMTCAAKILVLQADYDVAMAALEVIRHEAAQIDWDEVEELGAEEFDG